MKKSLFAILASSLVATAAMAQVNPCDVNYDNKVNTADVVAIYTNIIDGTTPTKPEMEELYFDIEYQGVTLNLKMMPVEGGTFMMGATSEQTGAEKNESPAHPVTLSSYYMEVTELPQAFWESVMGSNPSRHQGAFYPVENVSWNDCKTFISKLNTMLKDQLPDGMQFRLPTEAEWEFAARGGNTSMHYQYSGSNDIDEVAWYNSNSDAETHSALVPLKANELGLYDMSGNVWEWCRGGLDTYTVEHQTNPYGGHDTMRIIRGGCVSSDAAKCRNSYRYIQDQTVRDIYTGLRLVLARSGSE